jgi:hypothetical protein
MVQIYSSSIFWTTQKPVLVKYFSDFSKGKNKNPNFASLNTWKPKKTLYTIFYISPPHTHIKTHPLHQKLIPPKKIKFFLDPFEIKQTPKKKKKTFFKTKTNKP